MTQLPLECLGQMNKSASIKPFILSLFVFCCSQFASATEAVWSCKKTIYHNIYESTELTDSRVEQNLQNLKWINQDTISFQYITLTRSNEKSAAFVNVDGDFKTVFIKNKETPLSRSSHRTTNLDVQIWIASSSILSMLTLNRIYRHDIYNLRGPMRLRRIPVEVIDWIRYTSQPLAS